MLLFDEAVLFVGIMIHKYKYFTRLLVLLMLTIIVVMGAATFVEQAHGSQYVSEHIYHTVWFVCLWAFIVILSVGVLIRQSIWKRLPLLLLHGSFLVILLGSLVTFVWGRQGVMHLRPQTEVSNYIVMETGDVYQLPFSIKLERFEVEYYPGTEAPSDYVSHVIYKEEQSDSLLMRVSMNNILRAKGYRLYQSSFDEDQQGSWLSVNYDPWGTGLTYFGYILLGISMIWTLLDRNEEFRRLLNHPLLKKGGLFFIVGFFLSALPFSSFAQSRSLPLLNKSQADSLAQVQVIYQDRVTPFNTLARDFVQKIYGRASYHGFTAEQVIGGWLLNPEAWGNEPFIKVKSNALKQRLGFSSEYVSLNDLYNGSIYKLQTLWQEVNQSDPQSQLAKGILEVDEKVGLIRMLHSGTLIKPISEVQGVSPVSTTRLNAELLYNRIPFTKLLFMVNLTVGFFSFFYLLYGSLKKRKGKFDVWTERTFHWILYGVLAFHLFGYLLRWYIGGRIPLSNGYETMQFMALSILVLASFLQRRFPFTVTFGFLLSGFTLLVSYLGQMNPQITPLMPVLSSPLLSMHVSVIMIAYALLAFTLFDALLALVLYRKPQENKERIEQLTILSRLLLYPATFFLGAGIFLGAVWANVSWGSYWSWDPKEVWALITFLIYGAAFHRKGLTWFRNPKFFHIYMVVAFLSILMTYFGVNYVIGGMHSYA